MTHLEHLRVALKLLKIPHRELSQGTGTSIMIDREARRTTNLVGIPYDFTYGDGGFSVYFDQDGNCQSYAAYMND